MSVIPESSYRPCRWCGMSTKVETLSIYGARCFTCFDAYVHEPQKPLVAKPQAKPPPELGDAT